MDNEMALVARREFETFIRWYNEKLGAHPVIIGGWAVNYYNDYYGSKDIDVIFEARRKFYEPALNQFLVANGYKLVKQDIFVETFKKEMKIGKQSVEIDIDAADTSRENRFHADGRKSLSYRLCKEHGVEVSEEVKGARLTYRVPRLELLLAYKMKAYHDRNFELSNPDNVRLFPYYTSKRDKDGSDIVALLDLKNAKHKERMDYAFLNALIRQHRIKNEVTEVLAMISDRLGSRALYSRINDEKRVALVAGLRSEIA